MAVGISAGLVAATALANTPTSTFLDDLWTGTLGSGLGIQAILTLSTPLVFTGLAAAIPYRVGFWNIGGEGQFLLGAWAATWIGFTFPHAPRVVLIAAMLVGACVAGSVWALLPALARVYLGVNEIITTLLMNFVATYFALYWVAHRWLEPASAGGVKSRLLPEQSSLPSIAVTSSLAVPVGLIIAVVFAATLWLYLGKSQFGYEIDIIGASERVGRYAGMATNRRRIALLMLGGAMAGIGGAVELLGDVHRYGITLSNDTGYTGVVIAVLAAGSAIGVIIMALLFGLIFVGGQVLTIVGTSSDVTFAITGAILLLAAMGQGISHVRFVRTRRDTHVAGPDDDADVGNRVASVEERSVG